VRSEFGADVGLAAVAPAPGEGDVAGAVFLGLDIQGNATVERVMLTPDRRRMREFSVISLLNLLRRTLST
jgi:nicotinamide mononucleotide (NMN) deamidase PncC